MTTLLASALLSLASLAAAFEVPGEASWASKAQPELHFADPTFAGASAGYRFPALDPQRVDELKRHNAASDTKVIKIGIERTARAELIATRPSELQWQPAPDGGQTARMQVSSERAVALRVGLDIAQMPEGAELRFIGSADRAVVAKVGAADVATVRQVQPIYWSPVTEGDTQTIEFYLPPQADSRWMRVSMEAVSHLIVSPTDPMMAAKIGESDSCEIDAKCVSTPSTAYINAKNAVARMVFQSGGSSAVCTGTLLNDTDTSTQIPYFFSAAHCFTSQSVASTLTTFWFYEATGCGSGVLDASSRQVGGGGSVLVGNVASDVLFLRLNNPAPGGAFYSGWTSAAITTGTDVLVLHHPAGDVKKVSVGQVKGLGSSTLASGNFIKAGYTQGTTEGGSSGSGLLTLSASGSFQLRGGLLGGSASCANTGSISTTLNSDDFSRFDQAFPSLQQYLQPATTTPTPPSTIDYSGAWSNPNQSGWGLVVVRGGSGTYAMYIYHYDSGMFPTWYLSFGALSGTQYNADIRTFTGPWFGTPFNPNQVTNVVSGTLSVNFTSATAANITFVLDGQTVTTTLTKLAF